jgi:hypothetical protein
LTISNPGLKPVSSIAYPDWKVRFLGYDQGFLKEGVKASLMAPLWAHNSPIYSSVFSSIVYGWASERSTESIIDYPLLLQHCPACSALSVFFTGQKRKNKWFWNVRGRSSRILRLELQKMNCSRWQSITDLSRVRVLRPGRETVHRKTSSTLTWENRNHVQSSHQGSRRW